MKTKPETGTQKPIAVVVTNLSLVAKRLGGVALPPPWLRLCIRPYLISFDMQPLGLIVAVAKSFQYLQGAESQKKIQNDRLKEPHMLFL